MFTDINQPIESMGFSSGLRQQLMMLCFDYLRFHFFALIMQNKVYFY